MPTASRVKSLTYAVRPGVLFKYLGQLSVGAGIATLVPLLVAALFGELALAFDLGLVAAVLIMGGTFFARLPAPERLQTNEALIIAALIFVLVPLLMALPIMQAGIPFVDALFESVSAITTTGLTTLGTVADKTESFLFVRAWMQWYGGLGIVVLSLALLVEPGTAARRFGHSAMEWDDLITGTRIHARRVMQVYLVLTAIGIAVLWLAGVDAYSAVLHTLAGVSTGGFSSHDNSLSGLGGWVAQATLMALSFAGAIALILYHPAYYRNWRQRTGYLELKGLAATAVGASLLLALCMWLAGQHSWPEIWTHSPLIAVSAQTGTGFTSMPIEDMSPASKVVLIASMLVGGGVGSTTGGIKILRLLIFLRLLQLVIQRTCMPSHAVLEPRLGGHRLDHREIEHALLIIILFIGVIIVSWLPFLVLGHDPLDALFEVVSATATVGLSTGISSPELAPLLKAILCADMVLGRLEVVALILVLYPGTWLGKRR